MQIIKFLNLYKWQLAKSLFCLSISNSAITAPLDHFIIANPAQKAWQGEVAAKIDIMNSNLDMFHFQKKNDPDTDYTGSHIQAGLALTAQLWIDGAIWQRSLTVGALDGDITSWQIAGQYQLIDGSDGSISLALRAGLWGNYTGNIAKNYSLLANSTSTDFIDIDHPHDQQSQIDVILSWPITSHTTLSTFATIGAGEVDFDTAKATTLYKGCLYNLTFERHQYIATLNAPCKEDIDVTRFSHVYSRDDINIYKEMRYKSRFYQVGLMDKWQTENWRLRAGLVYLIVNREYIDEAIEYRHNRSYKDNQSLLMDASYRMWKYLFINVSIQYFNHQFAGEIPFIYNSATAKHFDRPYGLFAGGLSIQF